MDKLTPHQEVKLRECVGHPYVHLKAPAGAGKTFVALNCILTVLTGKPDPLTGKPATVLFAACNLALCLFVARWLCRRIKNTLLRASALRRLHIIFLPFEQGPQSLSVERGRIERTPVGMQVRKPIHDGESSGAHNSRPGGGRQRDYSLVVIDEAHHVFSHHSAAMAKYIPVSTDKMLLSDINQATKAGINWPEGDAKEVLLTEVVRSSKRIVAGSDAFQLAVDEVTSHHAAEGPPLKAFIFDRPDTSTEGMSALYMAYAEHIIKALEHTMKLIGEISLHDRVAVIEQLVDVVSSWGHHHVHQ